MRARMCQVLAKVGPSIVPSLLEWLDDPRWYLVRNLVHVLGKIGDESAFGPVVTLLSHPHARVRIESVRALALIAPARAAAPLVTVSRDVDPEVRLEVVHALGALRREEAITVLRDVAAGGAGDPVDAPLRREAIEALAAIGTRRVPARPWRVWRGGASGRGSAPRAGSGRWRRPPWRRSR